MKTLSFQENRILIFLFIIAIIIAIFVENAFLGSILFILLGVLSQRLILSQLLFTSLIESILIADPGVTISKILIVYYLIYFIVYLTLNKLKIYFKGINYAFIFGFLVIVGLLNVLRDSNVVNYAGGNMVIISDTFFVFLPRIVLFILLVIFLKQKGTNFIIDSLNAIKTVFPFVVIVLLIYFINNFQVSNWYGIVEREHLLNSDPNEFSIALASFIPFILLSFYQAKNTITKVINILAFAAIFYLVVVSGSKSGFISVGFALLVSFFLFKWIKISSTVFFMIIGIIFSIYILIVTEIVNINNIILRFTYTGSDLNSLTTNRADVWLNAIKMFPERPVFGYGISKYCSRYYNLRNLGLENVMHSVMFQVFFQLGIVGLTSLFFLLKYPFKQNFLLKTKNKTLLLPFLSLLILIFGAMSLSWLWRELIWINLAVCYAIDNLNKENSI